jgi:hypothetical protein
LEEIKKGSMQIGRDQKEINADWSRSIRDQCRLEGIKKRSM